MLLEYISLASGLNFTFLAVVLHLRNKQNIKSTKILIRLLLFMALYSSIVYYHYKAVDKGLASILSYYLPVDGIILALLAPCLYFYVMAIIEVSIPRNWKTLMLHSLAFIPFIAFNIYFTTLTRTERLDWLLRDFHVGTLENNLLNVVLYTQILVYLSVSYVQVKRKLKQPCINIVDAGTENYNWLKKYLLINMAYTAVSIPFCFYFANERVNIIIGQLAMNIQFVYLFIKITSNNTTDETQNTPTKKSTNKKLNKENVDTQFQKLNAYIINFKPFLNESCSLQTLSEQTGIPQYQLTYLINCKFSQTFPEYINQLRIQTAHELLLNDSTNSLTIESIAHTCGFGSKSAFNRAFKKCSQNLTPTEFAVKHKKISEFD